MELITTNQNREEIELFYNSLEQTDADFLKAKEYEIVRIGNSYLTDLGKIFKETQDRLSSHDKTKGTFGKWIEVIGMKTTSVFHLIKRYEYVIQNLNNINQIETFESLPKSLSYEISKPSAPRELVESVMNGDITTHKEYMMLKQKCDIVEEKKRLLEKDFNEVHSNLKLLQKKNEELATTLEDKEEELQQRPTVYQTEVKEIEKLVYKDDPDLLKRINMLTSDRDKIKSELQQTQFLKTESEKAHRDQMAKNEELFKKLEYAESELAELKDTSSEKDVTIHFVRGLKNYLLDEAGLLANLKLKNESIEKLTSSILGLLEEYNECY